MKYLLTAVVILFFASTASARIYIPIDQASDQMFPIAVCDLDGPIGMGGKLPSIIRNDLDLSGYFKVIPQSVFEDFTSKSDITAESIRFSFWASIEVQALVKGKIESVGRNVKVTLRLFDPYLQTMLVSKEYEFPGSEEQTKIREVAHRFSDEIMEALTGIRGVFNTKIIYTAAVRKGRKEIFIMDMDGENTRRVTNLGSITLGASLSPNGRTIAFTSYWRGNPDLYAMDIGEGKPKQLIGGTGNKITPSWSPDGKTLAFSSALEEDSELYTIPFPSQGKVKQITFSVGIDLAPTWSPDGSQIIFSSERNGGLHLYKTGAYGGAVTRLTYVGYQNDMPNWSPRGDKVTFAGRDMGTFDIFIMNPDGSNIQRLTIESGSNEHPTWSPDGRFITFSSTRGGETAIYIMRADGSNQRRVSKGNGILPEWGPRN